MRNLITICVLVTSLFAVIRVKAVDIDTFESHVDDTAWIVDGRNSWMENNNQFKLLINPNKSGLNQSNKVIELRDFSGSMKSSLKKRYGTAVKSGSFKLQYYNVDLASSYPEYFAISLYKGDKRAAIIQFYQYDKNRLKVSHGFDGTHYNYTKNNAIGTPNKWHDLQVSINNGKFNISIDGQTVTASHPFENSVTSIDTVEIMSHASLYTRSYFDNISLVSGFSKSKVILSPNKQKKVKSISLANKLIELKMTEDGRFLSLYDKRVSEFLVKNWANSGAAWELSYTDGAKLNSIQAAGPATVKLNKTTTGSQLLIKWTATNKQGLAVDMKIDLNRRSDELLFSVIIKNGKHAKEIKRFAFPANFGVSTNKKGFLLIPSLYSGLLYPLDKVVKIKPSVYPGTMRLQLVGVRAGEIGAAFYPRDSKGYAKFTSARNENGTVIIDYSNEVWVKPNKEYHIPYQFVIKMIPQATPALICKEYRRWSEKQWWFKPLKAKEKQVPLLSKMKNGYYRLPGCIYAMAGKKKIIYSKNFAERMAAIKRMKKLYDFDGGVWSAGFSFPFDSRFPDYFPITSSIGTNKEFKDFNKELNSLNTPVMYHMNPILWCKKAPSFIRKFTACWRGKSYPIKIAGGSTYYMSPKLTLKRELKTIKRMINEFKVSGFYFDVFGHSFAHDDNPLANYDPKTIGRNNWAQAKIASYKAFRDNAPKVTIMTEIGSELLLPYVDMFFGVAPKENSFQYPAMWQMIYGDRVISTLGWTPSQKNRDKQALYGANYCLTKSPVAFEAYTQSLVARQKIMAGVVGKLMTDHQETSEFIMSLWNEGIAVYNKSTSPLSAEFDTKFGKLVFSELASNNLLMVLKNGAFFAKNVSKITLNDKLLFLGNTQGTEIVNYVGGIYVINDQDNPVDVSFSIAPLCDNLTKAIAILDTSFNSITTVLDVESKSNMRSIKLSLPSRVSGKIKFTQKLKAWQTIQESVKKMAVLLSNSLKNAKIKTAKREKLYNALLNLSQSSHLDYKNLVTKLADLKQLAALVKIPKGQVMLKFGAGKALKDSASQVEISVNRLTDKDTQNLHRLVIGPHNRYATENCLVDLSEFAGQKIWLEFSIISKNNYWCNNRYAIFQPEIVRQTCDTNLLPTGNPVAIQNLLKLSKKLIHQEYRTGSGKLHNTQNKIMNIQKFGKSSRDKLIVNIPKKFCFKYASKHGIPNLDTVGTVSYKFHISIPEMDYCSEITRMQKSITVFK